MPFLSALCTHNTSSPPHYTADTHCTQYPGYHFFPPFPSGTGHQQGWKGDAARIPGEDGATEELHDVGSVCGGWCGALWEMVWGAVWVLCGGLCGSWCRDCLVLVERIRAS